MFPHFQVMALALLNLPIIILQFENKLCKTIKCVMLHHGFQSKLFQRHSQPNANL